MIAFVGRCKQAEKEHWQDVLHKAFAQIDCSVEIKLFSQLSDKEKQQCDIAIVANPDVEELAQLANLTWVHSVWAGVDAMLQALSSKQQKPITKTHYDIVRLVDPFLAQTMSEAVLAWTLYLHRNMPLYQQQQNQQIWLQHSYQAPQEKTIGILGLGKLGLKSAERLHQNGFNVIGWSRQLKVIDNIQTVAGEEGLAFLLANSDIVINLLPLTSDTKGLLNKERFALCDQVGLMNFGRGGTQVEKDLLEALDKGQLSHAVLDVFEVEPLAATHPFWEHEKITLLPHISAPTSMQSASNIVAENIKRYFNTGIIPPVVDQTQGY
ncbi:glyoxylate/hydroxypyruvate reductase A [Marinomonas agarivorans]|nr:glyoxylate/hydroxypyruvate reductase A [Marinomonas agarivorans]